MPVVITEVPTPGSTAEVATPGQATKESTQKEQDQARHIIAAAEARAIITITETGPRWNPGRAKGRDLPPGLEPSGPLRTDSGPSRFPACEPPPVKYPAPRARQA